MLAGDDTGSIVTEVTVLTEDHIPIAPLSVEDYHRMLEAGIVRYRDPIELLDGVIVQMTPEGNPHTVAVSLLARWLIQAVGDSDERLVRLAAPLTLAPFSQPEPDLAVADFGDPAAGHPETAHIVIEVSYSSLRKDRGRKARIYAESGLPQYWIVDLVHKTVTVHLDPSEQGYRAIKTYAPPDDIDPRLFDIPPLDLEALFKHL
jgi:Uma2 family endonuclease